MEDQIPGSRLGKIAKSLKDNARLRAYFRDNFPEEHKIYEHIKRARGPYCRYIYLLINGVLKELERRGTTKEFDAYLSEEHKEHPAGDT